jgi:hypothetical protein
MFGTIPSNTRGRKKVTRSYRGKVCRFTRERGGRAQTDDDMRIHRLPLSGIVGDGFNVSLGGWVRGIVRRLTTVVPLKRA